MIMPGVQKPHWIAPARTKASWIRCGILRGPQAFNGDDLGAVQVAHFGQAGADGLAVYNHGAGAALPFAIAGLLGARST